MEHVSPALQENSLPSESPGKHTPPSEGLSQPFYRKHFTFFLWLPWFFFPHSTRRGVFCLFVYLFIFCLSTRTWVPWGRGSFFCSELDSQGLAHRRHSVSVCWTNSNKSLCELNELICAKSCPSMGERLNTQIMIAITIYCSTNNLLIACRRETREKEKV